MNGNTIRRASGFAPALAQWRWITALAALLSLAAVLLLAGTPAPTSADGKEGPDTRLVWGAPWYEGELVRVDLSQYLDADKEYVAEDLPEGLSLQKEGKRGWWITGTLSAEVEPYAGFWIEESQFWVAGDWVDVTVSEKGSDGKAVEKPTLIFTTQMIATLEPVEWTVGQSVKMTLPTTDRADYYDVWNLPNGISFDSENHELHGTPRYAADSYRRIHIRGADSDHLPVGQVSFLYRVDSVPSFSKDAMSRTLDVGRWHPNSEGNVTYTLPIVSGGNYPLRYSIDPQLSDPVSFTNFRGVGPQISVWVEFSDGVRKDPSQLLEPTDYTVTVTDADGDTDTMTFTLEITDSSQVPPLEFDAKSGPDLTYAEGIGAVSTDADLPKANRTMVEYSVSPALPAGLSIQPVGGRIVGVPEAVSERATYTLIAQEAERVGNERRVKEGGERVEVDFTLEVIPIVTISTERVEVTTETSAEYTVALSGKPSTDVWVRVYPVDSSKVTVKTGQPGNRLIFTADNWDTAQTVVIEGSDKGETRITHRARLRGNSRYLFYHYIPVKVGQADEGDGKAGEKEGQR